MKVFISYSVDDREFVGKVAQEITPLAEVKYWDQSKEPGENAWQTIFQWIDECDAALVVITDKVVNRGMSVGQEIGRAKAKGKVVIPLVEEGIPASALGCLSGITYESIPKVNPSSALERIKALIEKQKVKVDEADGITALALIGLAALVLVAFTDKGK